MKEFIEKIVQQLVDKPEAVRVDQISGEHTVVLEMQVDARDVGKVIGRKGQTADSLRVILAVASARQDKKFVLEIMTPPPKKH